MYSDKLTNQFLLKKSYVTSILVEHLFSLHMHAKPSFAHRLQTAKMASSRTSAQNNGPRVQNNRPWVKRVLIEREMW